MTYIYDIIAQGEHLKRSKKVSKYNRIWEIEINSNWVSQRKLNEINMFEWAPKDLIFYMTLVIDNKKIIFEIYFFGQQTEIR